MLLYAVILGHVMRILQSIKKYVRCCLRIAFEGSDVSRLPSNTVFFYWCFQLSTSSLKPQIPYLYKVQHLRTIYRPNSTYQPQEIYSTFPTANSHSHNYTHLSHLISNILLLPRESLHLSESVRSIPYGQKSPAVVLFRYLAS